MEVLHGGDVCAEAEKSIVVIPTHNGEDQERDSLALVQGQKEDITEELHWVVRQRSTVISP